MSNFSISIPTLNRAEVLSHLLLSILNQSVYPKEVVIVDDSKNDETKNLVKRMQKDFSSKNIELKYLRGKGQGVTQARNAGIANSTGEIHCSLDDDVILQKDYIKEILKVYEAYPDVSGVAGHVINIGLGFPARSNAICKLFPSFFLEKDKSRVFATGVSYPYPLTHTIECEWLSGNNCTYKRKILGQFKWDENLSRYSLCDDMDISYRIQKSHPKSVLMTPNAKVLHKHSELARISSEYRTHMEISYHTYFFFKNVKQTPWNLANFVYGIFLGRFAASLLTRNSKLSLYTIKAEINMARHLKEIKAGVFTSFERRKTL